MSVPAGRPPISAVNSQRVPEVLRSGRVTFQDFNRNEHDQRIYLTLLVPILDGPDHSQALGVLALRINPEAYLYPFISRWPTPSRTAETLLVRRDGNDVLFLNELKFQTNAALNLRISLENTNVAAVKAVLGQEGVVEGVDYRGVPVLAALHAIPDSPWFMVARMDIAEVYAPLRERLRLTILLGSLLLVSAGLGIVAFWRHQRLQFYKAHYQMAEALRESEERFRRVFEEGPIGMAMLDETFRFIQVNPAFASMLGYSEEELQKMAFTDITHPEHVQKDVEHMRRLLRGELSVYQTEKRYIARSGKELWGQVQVAVVRNAAGAFHYFLAIISNITDRKRAEEALRLNQEQLLKVATQIRCILTFGHAEGPADWRERALNPESPFHWDFPVLNEEAAQKILPLEQAASERYQEAWFRSRNRDDDAQMNWISGNAFLNDLPFYRNVFRCTDKNGVGHWMQEFVTVRKLAENRWEVFGISTDVSDLKRVEAELRESQAIYHSLVEQMPAGVFRKDAKGRFLFVNSAFCRLKEMSPDQFLGKTVLEVESKDVALATKCASHHATIMQSGNRIEDEEVYSRADGEIRNYHVVKSPVLDSAGKIVGTQGILFDITERKQATLRIADALNFNQTVLRASPVGIVAFKASGSCVSANETVGQIIGGTREEVLKQNFRQLESWKHSGMLAAAEAALAAQTERNLETQLVTTFGRKAWFSCRFAPFHYEGEPHLLIVINDITERKRAEEALHWSETQLQVILESTADGILAVDNKGKMIKTNRRFAELWRIPQSLMDIRDDRALLDFVLAQLSEPDTFLKKEQSLYKTDAVDMDTLAFKDGRIFERYYFPMMMDGAVIGRVWSFRDITVRKHQEKELSEKNSELERFTYTVSHDLKSPLVTLKTFLGYLEQDMAGPDKERVNRMWPTCTPRRTRWASCSMNC